MNIYEYLSKGVDLDSVELLTKANYQDFQRFQSVDISMPADAEATLPALIEAAARNVSRGLTNLSIFEIGAVFQPAKPVVDRFVARHGFRKRASLARRERQRVNSRAWRLANVERVRATDRARKARAAAPLKNRYSLKEPLMCPSAEAPLSPMM